MSKEVVYTRLYCVRVMFKFVDKDFINFKIITDTDPGIRQFVDSLKKLDNIDSIAYEYLHEYDTSRLGILNEIFKKGGK